MRTGLRIRIVKHQEPAPEVDPHYRGLGISAVPVDTIAIDTVDGTLVGEVISGEVTEVLEPLGPLMIVDGNGNLYVLAGVVDDGLVLLNDFVVDQGEDLA
jgi:hypothetical protein